MMAAIKCDPRTNIVGVELNVSCPNVEHDKTSDYILNIVDKLLPFEFPLIVKLSYDQPFEEICKELVGKVAGVDLINSVPWKMLHPKKSSPLKRYNLVGGVSGEAIKKYAEDALSRTAKLGVPIISGGGISSYDDVKLRFENGASAVSFGSVFIRRPWLPNEIVRKWSNDKIRKAKRQSFVRPDSSVECCKSDREKMVV
jgi:dihydroorotate dehydrogenase